MQEKIIWFVCGYIYCVIVSLVMDYKGKKKVDKNGN